MVGASPSFLPFPVVVALTVTLGAEGCGQEGELLSRPEVSQGRDFKDLSYPTPSGRASPIRARGAS
jgi:hypothetical protein